MHNFINPAAFGKDLQLYTGIVEDRTDPQTRGRVRVRIFGLHRESIPTDELPWSVALQPVNSAAISGVGIAPTGLMLGSLVVLVFLDGTSMQQSMVIGTLGMIEATSSNGVIGPGGVDSSAATREGYKGPGTVQFTGDGPKWLQVANSEIGTKESKNGSNPRVVEYAQTNGFTEDETAWCSSFAKWCVKNAGFSVEGINGLARSWSRAGCVEKLDKPLLGCITVLSRGSDPSKGHVGFLKGVQGGSFKMLGGNQSDAVNVGSYNSNRLVGFYWPKSAPKSKEFSF